MTKLFLTFLIGLLFLAPLYSAHPHAVNGNDNHNVEIPDAVLRGIIETRLFITPAGTPITANKMAGLDGTTGLDEVVKADQDIHDLTGLEHATKLKKVRIGRNRFRHPPSGRTTTNTVSDLSPLANLPMLAEIDFITHRITDLSPLATLTTLKVVRLSSNSELADLSPLANLTNITQLHLERCNITDITAIGTLTNLQELRLGVNWDLQDISPLANLSNLRDLRINSTAITPEGLSAVLPALEGARNSPGGIQYWAHLDITNTDISDLSVLDGIPDGVFMHSLTLQFMGTSARGTRFFLLKDLTPLVDLMNKGKVVSPDTDIRLRWNFRLDYPSLYEDIPALIAQSKPNRTTTSDYLPSTPSLEKESPTDEPYRGHPGTRHTFVVRAINDTPYSNYPLERTQNRTFNGVPVTFTVTNPDGTTETHGPVLTGTDGLSEVTITLGNDGETHTVEAVVPANTRPSADGPSHVELRVTFTAIADSTVPPPTPTHPDEGLTVTFEDYPETPPTHEFNLTLRFSEPVTDLQREDITVQTELKTGTGTATLKRLIPITEARTPTTEPAELYISTIRLPADATGTVKLTVLQGAVLGSTSEQRGPAAATDSDPISFGADALARKRSKHIPPSKIAMDRILFNEFRNAANDTRLDRTQEHQRGRGLSQRMGD